MCIFISSQISEALNSILKDYSTNFLIHINQIWKQSMVFLIFRISKSKNTFVTNSLYNLNDENTEREYVPFCVVLRYSKKNTFLSKIRYNYFKKQTLNYYIISMYKRNVLPNSLTISCFRMTLYFNNTPYIFKNIYS